MDWYRIKNKFIARLISHVPLLEKHFLSSHTPLISDNIPWTPFTKLLSECTVAVVTTSGVHHREQTPFNMHDRQGDPSYRVIDATRPNSTLMITHDYYDHRDADRDVNIVFPLDRLREFEKEGIIRRAAKRHYSFMGHILGEYVAVLNRMTAREVAGMLKRDAVDAVLLTPG